MGDELREEVALELCLYCEKNDNDDPCTVEQPCEASLVTADTLISILRKSLPTNEEIHIKIVHCLYGGGSVPELEKWLKENFQR